MDENHHPSNNYFYLKIIFYQHLPNRHSYFDLHILNKFVSDFTVVSELSQMLLHVMNRCRSWIDKNARVRGVFTKMRGGASMDWKKREGVRHPA